MTTTVGVAEVTYSPRAMCDQFLPPLASAADPDCFPDVGTKVQCPDCGRKWTAVESVAWASPVQVTWQCSEPPPAQWPAPAGDLS